MRITSAFSPTAHVDLAGLRSGVILSAVNPEMKLWSFHTCVSASQAMSFTKIGGLGVDQRRCALTFDFNIGSKVYPYSPYVNAQYILDLSKVLPWIEIAHSIQLWVS